MCWMGTGAMLPNRDRCGNDRRCDDSAARKEPDPGGTRRRAVGSRDHPLCQPGLIPPGQWYTILVYTIILAESNCRGNVHPPHGAVAVAVVSVRMCIILQHGR